MGIITKVFIVLMTVLSIAFVMVTVAHVAQEVQWRSLALDYQSAANMADAALRQERAVAAAEKLAFQQKIAELTRRLEAQADALRQAQAERDTALADLEAARGQIQNKDLALTSLTGMLQTVSTEAAELRKQRNDLEKQLLAVQSRNIDLSDRNRELSTQVLTMAEQIRQLQQLNAAKDEEIKRLQRIAGGAEVAEPTIVGRPLETARAVSPVAPRAIRGHIKEVHGDVASITVGSTDGVAPGMRFIVYRGSQYLGELVVSDVEPEEAAGALENVQDQIRAGDRVLDEVHFMKEP